MKYVILDEFGHDGPYLSKNHPRYMQSPVFGFGGIILPSENVRRFCHAFVDIKCRHLHITREKALNSHERKGGEIFYTRALTPPVKQDVRKTGHRLFNMLEELGGQVFYSGMEKFHAPAQHSAENLHIACMRHAVEELDDGFANSGEHSIVIFDEHTLHTSRTHFIVRYLFNKRENVRIIEPPFQGVSLVYNSIQAADWLCAILGKIFM